MEEKTDKISINICVESLSHSKYLLKDILFKELPALENQFIFDFFHSDCIL